MTYFFMLLCVFLWAWVVAGYLLRDAEGLSYGAKIFWALMLAVLATFFAHNIL